MSDDIPNDMLALYRASAIEEPDTAVDAAILKAAHRRSFPHPAVVGALAAVVVLAVVAHTHHPSTNLSGPATTAAQPAALDAGRERYFAIDATAQPPAMRTRPVSFEGENQ